MPGSNLQTILIYEQTSNSPDTESDTLLGSIQTTTDSFSKSVSVSTGYGSKKVYAKSIDENGNESPLSLVINFNYNETN